MFYDRWVSVNIYFLKIFIKKIERSCECGAYDPDYLFIINKKSKFWILQTFCDSIFFLTSPFSYAAIIRFFNSGAHFFDPVLGKNLFQIFQ